ncbi:MAG: hypothetical protein M1821_000403 [Bathelium mastoideum]|nr:MAG: hypothetical protein M1821_000403 [Bathelium mastoideum]
MFSRRALLVESLLLAIQVFPSIALDSRAASYMDNAVNATDVLNNVYYNSGTGLWNNLWWNSANALTVVADLAKASSAYVNTAEGIFASTFQNAPGRAKGPGWTDNYYDDEGWWALAWLDAFDLTSNQTYFGAAVGIYNDMQTGNNATCGGHWWDKSHSQNNAIGNELYMSVAAHLAERTSGDDRTGFLNDALREWNWFKNSGLIDSNNTVHDGLNLTTCQLNYNSTTWTYIQGVILGALISLNNVQSDPSYLQTASNIAHAVLTRMVDSNGILIEWGGSLTPDENASQFKGVFVRNLLLLQQAQPDDAYVSFLQNNADGLWANARDAATGLIGPDWQGPYEDNGMSSQNSAASCLLAAALVS